MPKFLDAPSWYDSDGNKRTIVTTMRIGVSNTGGGCYCNVPVISEGSVNLDGIPEQPLYTLPFLSGTQSVGGIPYWSGTQNGYRVFGQGTSGQVLTSNGNAAPSWEDIEFPKMWGISFHNAQLGQGAATNAIDLYVMSSTNPNITDMNGVQDLIQAVQESGYRISISLINGYVNSTYRPESISYQNKTTQPMFRGLLIEGRNGSTSTTAQISYLEYDDYTVRTYPYDFTNYIY